MTKIDIRTYICPHRHRPFTCRDAGDSCSHISCWQRARYGENKVCYLDIEVSQLAGDFGVVISWFIKLRDEATYYHAAITEADVELSKKSDRVLTDRRILTELSHVLADLQDQGYRYIVCHYGTIMRGLDIRFLRTRFIKYGLKFPVYGQMFGLDTYLLSKYKLALHSNRLDTIARFLGAPEQKTTINEDAWILAGYGHEKSIHYVEKHNKIDVNVLEFVHKRLEVYGNLSRTSL